MTCCVLQVDGSKGCSCVSPSRVVGDKGSVAEQQTLLHDTHMESLDTSVDRRRSVSDVQSDVDIKR
jgi:hypothetical protein